MGRGALRPSQDFSAKMKGSVKEPNRFQNHETDKIGIVKFYDSFARIATSQVSVILRCKVNVLLNLSVLHMNFKIFLLKKLLKCVFLLLRNNSYNNSMR